MLSVTTNQQLCEDYNENALRTNILHKYQIIESRHRDHQDCHENHWKIFWFHPIFPTSVLEVANIRCFLAIPTPSKWLK